MEAADVIAIISVVITVVFWAIERCRASKAEKENAKAIEAAKTEAAAEAAKLRAEIARISAAIEDAAGKGRDADREHADREWVRREVKELVEMASKFARQQAPSDFDLLYQKLKLIRPKCQPVDHDIEAMLLYLDTLKSTWGKPYSPNLGSLSKYLEQYKTSLGRIIDWLAKY